MFLKALDVTSNLINDFVHRFAGIFDILGKLISGLRQLTLDLDTLIRDLFFEFT